MILIVRMDDLSCVRHFFRRPSRRERGIYHSQLQGGGGNSLT